MTTKTGIGIDEALRDRLLLGSALGPTSSWATWMVVLKAAFGIQLNRVERRAFASVAGSRKPPRERVRELWAIVGRGGGKSRMAAAISVYLACFEQPRLDPGEEGFILTLAASQAQARVVFNYCNAFLQKSRILRRMVKNRTATEIQLTNNVTISVHSNSFRNIRGRTLLAVVFDETSLWRDESSANPDLEVYRAVMPSLVRTGGMLVSISTPYQRRGLMYSKWQDHYDVDDDDVPVVKGATSQFNPCIDEKKIAKELASDREGATSEWLAEWRSDVSGLLDDQVIEDSIDYARPLELPPRGFKYFAFADSSAGRNDAFTLCIGHTEGKKEEARFICDVIRGVPPPFDPRSAALEFAQLARQYGCNKVIGDAFAGAWTANAFADAGAQYETSPLAKSPLYLESVASFNRNAVSTPNHEKLLRELRNLERRVHRSGRDSVDHPRSGSDDLANALVGCLYVSMNDLRRPRITTGFWCPVVVPGHDYSKGNVSYPGEQPEQSGRITITRVSEAEALEQKAKGTCLISRFDEETIKMDDKAMQRRELELRTICPTSDHWPDTYVHEKNLLAARNEIRAFVADAFDQLDAIEGNRDLTPDAKKRLKTKIGGEIISKMQSSPTHGRIRNTVDHVLSRWQAQIDDNLKRPTNAHEAAVHAQIRDRLYAMKPETRMSWMERNVDDALIGAVLTAPSYLSGLSEAQYRFVQSKLEKKVAPEILTARKFVQEAIDDLERGWKAGMHKIGTRAGLRKSADGTWSQPVEAEANAA